MTSYGSLLNDMWVQEGSETHTRLLKLQELEKMRKQREAARVEKNSKAGVVKTRPGQYQTSTDSSTGSSRRRMFEAREDLFDTQKYGGARPKYGSSDDNTQSSGNMFSGVADEILGKPNPVAPRRPIYKGYGESRGRLGSEGGDKPVSAYTSSYRSRLGSADSDEGKENMFSGLHKSPTYKPDRSKYSRSVSKPEGQEQRLYDGSEGQEQRLYDGSEGQEQRLYDGSEGQETNGKTKEYGEHKQYSQYTHPSQQDGQQNPQQTEEDDLNAYEETEEPVHFIQRLKGEGYQSDGSAHSDSNSSHHKRSARNDYMISSIPTVPPFKRAKGEETQEEYSDLPSLIHPVEDNIISVAQDIRDVFGQKSPQQNGSNGFDFSEAAGIGELDNTETKHVLLGENGEEIEVVQVDQYYENADPDGGDGSEGMGLRTTVYTDGTTDWIVTEQPQGKLDEIQHFFSGQEVSEDPQITHYLNGRLVGPSLEDSMAWHVPMQNSLLKTPDSTMEEEDFDTPENSQDPPRDNDSTTPKNSEETAKKIAEYTNMFDDLNRAAEVSPTKTNRQSNQGCASKESQPTKDKSPGKTETTNASTSSPAVSETKTDRFSKTPSSASKKWPYSKKSSPAWSSSVKSSTPVPPPRDKTRASKANRVSTPPSVDASNEDSWKLSLEDKLAKLESMTTEKSKKLSEQSDNNGTKAESPSRLSPSTERSSFSSRISAVNGVKSSPNIRRRDEPSSSAGEKSPKDIIKDIRNLTKFAKDSPSDAIITTGPRTRLSKDGSFVDATTMTDMKGSSPSYLKNSNGGVIYCCPHCGKSSEESVAKKRAPVPLQKKAAPLHEAKDIKQIREAASTLLNTGSQKEKRLVKDTRKDLKDKKEPKKETSRPPSRNENPDSKLKLVKESSRSENVNVKTKPVKERSRPPSRNDNIDGKTMTVPVTRSYMKTTASSKNKTAKKDADTAEGSSSRKGSIPEISYVKTRSAELEAQRENMVSPALSVKSVGRVTRKAKKPNDAGKKPLTRGASVDQSKAHYSALKSSALAKSKSVEQVFKSEKQKNLRSLRNGRLGGPQTGAKHGKDSAASRSSSISETEVVPLGLPDPIMPSADSSDDEDIFQRDSLKDFDSESQIDSTTDSQNDSQSSEEATLNETMIDQSMETSVDGQPPPATDKVVSDTTTTNKVVSDTTATDKAVTATPVCKRTRAQLCKKESDSESDSESETTKTSTTKDISSTDEKSSEVKTDPEPSKVPVSASKFGQVKTVTTPYTSSNRSGSRSVTPTPEPPVSPREQTGRITPAVFDDDDDDAVVSRGQFTTIEDNPFIKNDSQRRNSLRSKKDSDSVWTKTERSPVTRSNTSAGERSRTSSGSLYGSNSSLHGSNSSLHRTFSERLGSVSSRDSRRSSQNSMLNLLAPADSPSSSHRHAVSGAIETDIDAAYNEFIKKSPNKDEDPTAHLDFAEQTLSVLDAEAEKRSSSSDSLEADNNSVKEVSSASQKDNVVENQTETNETNNKKAEKKQKNKKGFFKGNFFKK